MSKSLPTLTGQTPALRAFFSSSNTHAHGLVKNMQQQQDVNISLMILRVYNKQSKHQTQALSLLLGFSIYFIAAKINHSLSQSLVPKGLWSCVHFNGLWCCCKFDVTTQEACFIASCSARKYLLCRLMPQTKTYPKRVLRYHLAKICELHLFNGFFGQ